MRLLFASNLFPDQTEPWRGLDNAVLLGALLHALPELAVKVLAFRPFAGPFGGGTIPLLARPEDIDLAPCYASTGYIPRAGGLNDFLFARAFSRTWRRTGRGFSPDALLVPWLFPDACGVARVRELSHLPMVAVAQGSDVHRYLNMPMRRRAILKMSGRVKKIITRSADLARRLMEAGVPEDKVQTVYNGVDTQLFRPGDRIAERVALGLPTEGIVALFVGNFLPVKGLDLLLEATARVVRQSGEAFTLLLVGGGPLEASLRARVTALGLTKRVIFAGRKNSLEVAGCMRAADLVCMSSLNEGVPNVVLEALASGRPVLATNVGGIAEIIGPRPGSGVLIEERDPAAYAEALTWLLHNSASEQHLRNYGTEFSWGRCAQAYLEALMERRD